MRTTIDLDDELLRRLKEHALRNGRTLREEVNDLLKDSLVRRKKTKYRFEWKTFQGGQVQPGVDLDDRDSLFDRMDGIR